MPPKNVGKEVLREGSAGGGCIITYSSGWRLVISPALLQPEWIPPVRKKKPPRG